MALKTAHLPISPSKTLLRFADRIALLGRGLVLDAPCGYGRNAVALASLGCSVIAIDNNPKRLRALEHSKASYISRESRKSGQIATICGDLRSDRWIFAPSSFSAIICVHFEMIDILLCFISSLQKGGYIYVESFGGHGHNFRAFCQRPEKYAICLTVIRRFTITKNVGSVLQNSTVSALRYLARSVRDLCRTGVSC